MLIPLTLGSVHSQLAGEREGEPDESSPAEEPTKPVDTAGRLAACPHEEAEREGPMADIVGGAARGGSEAPPGERQEQRRVRKLNDWKAAGPSGLAAPPELDDRHRINARTRGRSVVSLRTADGYDWRRGAWRPVAKVCAGGCRLAA